MHQEHGLQFRGYVPTLMELLEDADGMVREAAKSTVIELFKYVLPPPRVSGRTQAYKPTGTDRTQPSQTSRDN